MEEKGIKVVIDYARGYYTVAGVSFGNVYTINKPIRGVDNDSYYKDNFSRRLLNRRKAQIIRRLKSIQRSEPGFRYSRSLIDKVDSMLFKVLEDWDKTAGTDYSSEYLKIVTQKFRTSQYPGAPKDFLTENFKKSRMADMVDAGIEVSYNVGLFNANRNLSLLDRIRGIRFARAQRDMIGAEYHYSTRIKKDYYLPGMEKFITTLKKAAPTKKTLEEPEEDLSEPLGMTLDEILAEFDAQKREEAERNALAAHLSAEVEEVLGAEDEHKEDTTVSKAAKKPAHKRTIRRPHSPKSNTKKAQHYRNGEKKKRVKNHTGVRTEPSKKQREAEARRKAKEANTPYNRYLRRKAEQEQEEAERNARIAAAIKEKQEREAVIAAAIAEKKKKAAVIAEPVEPIEAEFVDGSDESPIRKTPRSGGRLERRILAEKRHWTRKLRDAKDSIRNKEFKPHLNSKGKKILITGAITLAAVGIIFGGSKIADMINRNDVRTTISTEIGTSGDESLENEDGSYNAIIIPADNETVLPEGSVAPENAETDLEQETTPVVTNEEAVPPSTGDIAVVHEKTEEEKMAEFKETAIKAYRDAIVIGEVPAVGDLFVGQQFSENPDGTGRKGSFDKHPDYSISHINIVTRDGWHTVRFEGKNLSDLLAEYPDMITYNFHVVNSKTGGWLGFVTQEQYEGLIQNKVNQIINSRTIQGPER